MFIYLFINSVNGKKYVGQTTKADVDLRLRQHRYVTTSRAAKRYALHAAIEKHGWDAFTRHVLQVCSTREELNQAEAFWIAHYDCMAPKGYNLTTGGDAPGEISDETRAKMSVLNRGRKHSVESRAKRSAALKGRPLPPEQVEAMKLRRHTPESLEKMAEAKRGKVHSEATRAIQEETQKDVKAIQEQKGALNDRVEEIFTRRAEETMGSKLRDLVRSSVREILGKL